MADITGGYNFKVVSGGVGTTVLTGGPTTLQRVIIPGTYVGSITIHNAVSAAGTSATSPILTLGLPTTSIPQTLDIQANCNKGLVFEATGTPLCTIIWG